MKKLLFFLFAFVLMASACKKTGQPGYSDFKLDKPFELKISQSASLKDGDLKLTFTAVPEDSRCPKGVSCIWEGEVKTMLVAIAGGETKMVEHVRRASQMGAVSQTVFGYTIDLLEVNPYPTQNPKIKKEDYVVKLAVRKG